MTEIERIEETVRAAGLPDYVEHIEAIGQTITRSDADAHLDSAERDFADWRQVRGTPEARVFLAALLPWGRWKT